MRCKDAGSVRRLALRARPRTRQRAAKRVQAAQSSFWFGLLPPHEAGRRAHGEHGCEGSGGCPTEAASGGNGGERHHDRRGGEARGGKHADREGAGGEHGPVDRDPVPLLERPRGKLAAEQQPDGDERDAFVHRRPTRDERDRVRDAEEEQSPRERLLESTRQHEEEQERAQAAERAGEQTQLRVERDRVRQDGAVRERRRPGEGQARAGLA